MAARFPQLPPETRGGYANAPTVFAFAAAAQLATFNTNIIDWTINMIWSKEAVIVDFAGRKSLVSCAY